MGSIVVLTDFGYNNIKLHCLFRFKLYLPTSYSITFLNHYVFIANASVVMFLIHILGPRDEER